MARVKDEDHLVKVYAVASLRSEGKLQKDIADALNMKQPEVSRLLDEAKKIHLLEDQHPRLLCPNPDLQEKMRARFFSADDLLTRLQKQESDYPRTLQSVHVFYSKEEELEPAAARHIADLLSPSRLVGVTWGRTMGKLVQGLRQAPRVTHAQRIEFVPLCGEPLRDRKDPLRFSSSSLARELYEIFNGERSHDVPSLVGIPAFIPRLEKDAKQNRSLLRTVRRVLAKVGSYAAVFGDPDKNGRAGTPLVEQLDTVLTSVGVADAQPRGIFLQERLELGELTEAELLERAVGDIGGIIIPRGLTAKKKQLVDELNAGWTGIGGSQLRRCAEHAAAGKRPGVIVSAFGPNRKEMVERCVELGLVNHLILDRGLAAALQGS